MMTRGSSDPVGLIERSASAAVECLENLIRSAVRSGDDDRVLDLDEVLRHVEAAMAAATDRARLGSPSQRPPG